MSEQDRIEALETENTLLSACLRKSEAQRDALLAALKEFAFVLNYQSIEIEAPGMANELNAAKQMAIATIAAVESGKVPS